MMQIIEIKDNPGWRRELTNNIDKIYQEFGVKPRILAGENFNEAMSSLNLPWIYDKTESPDGIIAKYEGISVEIVEGMDCIVLKV